MRKSQLKGFLLTLLFGPIGLFYSNVPLALVFLVLTIIVGTNSLGAAVLFWPLSIVMSVFTVKRRNTKGRVKQKEVKKKEVSEKVVGLRKIDESKIGVEELADFRISPSSRQIRSLHKGPKRQAKWIRPGESVKVGKLKIRGGFFYCSGQQNGVAGFHADADASLLDPSLNVDFRSPDYAGDQMGYWPRFSRISPQSRAAYIEWLASERADPDTYIGYVFLFFYGIERRLLIDDPKGEVSDDERKALVQELRRLKEVYGNHRSFSSYVTALLSHAWVFNHKSLGRKPDFDLLIAKRGFTSAFKFRLANVVQIGEPVDEELALAWVRSHPEFTLRTPARRCPDEFDELFKSRYRRKFGDGLEITPNKTRLQLDYQPASPSLRGYQNLKLDLPDVSRLRGPVRKLVTLAESCTSELDQFSRFVGRPENSHNSLSSISLLPNDLVSFVSNPRFEKLRAWMRTQVSDSGELVSTDSLLQLFGEDAPLKINKKEAEMLSSLVEKAGFGVAPDIRFHQAKPDIGGKIVLFPGGHGEGFSPTTEFRKVGTILRLGTLVAVTDDHISDSEVKVLKNVIAQDSRLTETEKWSLDAYLLWRLNTPANMSGLKKRLDLLSASEKVAISHVLVGVALADSKIEPAEIKQLEKLYTQLGLDRGLVASDIHSLSSSRIPRQDPAGEQDAISPIESESSFVLDRDLLSLLEEETKEAQSVLESIFGDEDTEEEAEVEVLPTLHNEEGAISRLDAQHEELYAKLISKAEWTREELEGLCKSLLLMTDGAVETINDWAFEIVDAPLIEDGSTVYVDTELAEEITEIQAKVPLP